MRPLRILFVCTHNRCRSILAEAIVNQYGNGSIIAASAGSDASDHIHAGAIDALKRHDIKLSKSKPSNIEQAAAFNADVVITLCDDACSTWRSDAQPSSGKQALHVHWGLIDPSTTTLEDPKSQLAFDQTVKLLRDRSESLLALLKQDADFSALERELLRLSQC